MQSTARRGGGVENAERTMKESGEAMREFEDLEGRRWVATVEARPGPDYKGRYYFLLRPADSSEDPPVPLEDVRWNSLRTAERTLGTMSAVELRRRLRSARGRWKAETAPGATPRGRR